MSTAQSTSHNGVWGVLLLIFWFGFWPAALPPQTLTFEEILGHIIHGFMQEQIEKREVGRVVAGRLAA